ncbi:MAG: SLC45 family MFS transporter [Clostridiales bacterium]|nr:SLC45 family MFS transporter [Clostridiales bacterium]
MERASEMKLNTKRTFLIGVVFLSISLLNGAHDNMTSKILLNQFNLDTLASGLIMAIDNILALFMLPIFGRFSDACNSKWGKRKPYVVWGTLAACLFLALFPIAIEMNSLPLFTVLICLFLISLGTYRSAGVALVSDMTIKPLRSSANAIINLMGAVAYVIGQVATMFLYKDIGADGTRALPIMFAYLPYIVITLVCLAIYFFKIPERKWTEEREKLEDELHLEDEAVEENGVKVKLDKDHFVSLMLVLVSIVLWTFGYNAVTTFYSQYADIVLGIKDGFFAAFGIVAGVASFASYIPIGWMATKYGRRKTIIFGLGIAAVAMFGGIFIRGEVAWLLVILFMMVGIAQAAITVNTLPMVVEFANKHTIGQFTGYYYIATQSAQAISPVIIGGIMKLLSVEHGIGIAGPNGMLALFPYSMIFVILSLIPLLFTKFGDAKAVPKKSALEMLDIDD